MKKCQMQNKTRRRRSLPQRRICTASFLAKGPNKIVLAFLQDRGLQLAAMVIVRVSEPVEHSYALDLKMMEGRCLFTVPSC